MRKKYIGIAIDSVLAQIFTRFELLIINDGSTDNTEKIIRSYIQMKGSAHQSTQPGNCRCVEYGFAECQC